MAMINVKDLREYAKEMKGDNLIKINIGGMDVEILKHTTMVEKVSFAGNLYNLVIISEDEKHVVDELMYDILYMNIFINKYTNIKLPKDNVEAYSLIVDTGIYNAVYNAMNEIEREELERVIADYFYEKKQEYLQEHDTGVVVKLLIENLTSLIPSAEEMEGMFAKLGKDVDEINFEDLKGISQVAKELGTVEDDGTPKQ